MRYSAFFIHTHSTESRGERPAEPVFFDNQLCVRVPAMADDPMKVDVPEIDRLFEIDGYLRSHEREIRRRWVVVTI